MKKEETTGISYCIHSFMLDEMELSASELLVFAIIHSFTKGELGVYYGTKELLARASKLSISTVKRAISSLMSKKYIEECYYGERLGYKAIPTAQGGNKPEVRSIYPVISPKYTYRSLGKYGIVQMTDEQHQKLLALVKSEQLQAYVRKLEILITDKDYKSFNHYKTIKKWITEDTAV